MTTIKILWEYPLTSDVDLLFSFSSEFTQISAASVLSKVGHGSVSADLIKSLPAKIADLVAR